MDLEDSSVDGALCRFGYMLMADPAAALAETRRVLRDGARLSFAYGRHPTATSGLSSPE
jgi:ubiquinone/menaquinone biosynthesis C-methylase UbiE